MTTLEVMGVILPAAALLVAVGGLRMDRENDRGIR
jgi:hypothetical protein